MGTEAATPGFYGKTPALGDFISRQLNRDFIDPWDSWLQSCLAFSKEDLGEYWLDTYLTSPIWRFVLSPGVNGASGWAGALMPSVDRVGRNFPLTITVPLEPTSDPWQVTSQGSAWFERVEAQLLSALDEELFDVSEFESRVAALGPVDSGMGEPSREALQVPAMLGAPWRIGLDTGLEGLNDRIPDVFGAALASAYGAFSLWWTAGSDYVRPSLLVCRGLPPAQGYTSMIAAQWEASGWQDSSPEPPSPPDELLDALGPEPITDPGIGPGRDSGPGPGASA